MLALNKFVVNKYFFASIKQDLFSTSKLNFAIVYNKLFRSYKNLLI